eukprot:EG_transcript_6206
MAWASVLRLIAVGAAAAFVSARQDAPWHAHFAIKRRRASCVRLVAAVLEAPPATLGPNCLVYQFGELRQAAAYGVSYTKEADPHKYQLRMASLTVQGHLDAHDLSFHCPTEAYLGTPPTPCDSAPNKQLAVLHVGADHRLYSMDIVRAPANYPPARALAPNQAGFGTATMSFPAGVLLQESGFLRLCKLNAAFPPARCKALVYPPRAAQVPMPSHVGMGTFLGAPGAQGVGSDWMVDVDNQLSAVTVGATRYYFNSAGAYVSKDGTCSASADRDYSAHLQGRSSAFLDHSAAVTLIAHPSGDAFAPARVDVWVGVVFDVDQIKAAVLYTDDATGYHRGMDTFDVASLRAGLYTGSHWYSSVAPTLPGLSAWAIADRMATLGDPCAAQLSCWLRPHGPRAACPDGLVLNDGLCEASTEPSSPSDTGMLSDMLEWTAYSSQWALPTTAAAVALGLGLAGLTWVIRRRPPLW